MAEKILKPSYFFRLGDNPADYESAWGSAQHGRFADCPTHGSQFVVERTFVSTNAVYDDGSRDRRYTEKLACGCLWDCWAYAHDPEIRKYPL